jgi:RHS repeat-associated protein
LKGQPGIVEYLLDPWGMRTLQVTSSTLSTRYFLTDHLGSVSVITDENGLVVQRLSYDAWGKRRNPDGTDDTTGSITSQTTRGFTGEEMLSVGGLVHLNGRVYDPLLARMTSADPTVTDPTNPQGWNRYSYVGNDPLAFTDPNGFSWLSNFFHSVSNFISQNWTALLNIALNVVLNAVTLGACVPCVAAVSSAIVTGISGGSFSQILKSAAIAGVTAFAFSQIGPTPSFADNPAGFVEHVGESALVGCAQSAASGGSCKSGALSAAVGAALSPVTRSLGGGLVTGTIVQATAGGLASVAGGGKFANGAVTAAFQYLATASLEKAQDAMDAATRQAIHGDPMDAMAADPPGIGHNGPPEEEVNPGSVGRKPPEIKLLYPDPAQDHDPNVLSMSAPMTNWDTSGGFKGINTNVSADEFIDNLRQNGYTGTTSSGKNGPVTVLQNGEGSTCTVYTRTSTGSSGAQYSGPDGQLNKYNLGR